MRPLASLQTALILGAIVAASPGAAAEPVDTDHDGVSDRQERALGLDPRLVNIPEPLLFDMVRGLGARRGELEVNVLADSRLRTYGRARDRYELQGGPEMEYVFADGYGLEVELPLSTSGVEAWKFAVQGTLPYWNSGRFIHGWLGMGEYLVDDPRGRGTALYVAAYRLDEHWSAIAMVGAQGTTKGRDQQRSHLAAVFNPSVFYDASSKVTLGVELNKLLEPDGTVDLVVLPQVHFQPTAAWKIQMGTGVHVDQWGASHLASIRVATMF